MSGKGQLPEVLRRALASDHGAVRPLRPAGLRALPVAIWAIVLLGALPALLGLRGDAAALGGALSWGAAAVECALGLTLVRLALLEAVPGSGVALPGRFLALAGGLATQLLVALVCWVHSGMPHGSCPPAGATCLPIEGTLGLPAFALTLLLVARAHAVRPRWAGVLGGAGAGLLTDGVWHLICPYADLGHVLVWHGGAVLALTGMGWLTGYAIEIVHGRRLSRQG